jgi:hypothetical protein
MYPHCNEQRVFLGNSIDETRPDPSHSSGNEPLSVPAEPMKKRSDGAQHSADRLE